MATKLNTAKDARKTIKKVEEKQKESIAATYDDGTPFCIDIMKVKESREDAKEGLVKIETTISLLEKDSAQISFYIEKKEELEKIIKSTEKYKDYSKNKMEVEYGEI